MPRAVANALEEMARQFDACARDAQAPEDVAGAINHLSVEAGQLAVRAVALGALPTLDCSSASFPSPDDPTVSNSMWRVTWMALASHFGPDGAYTAEGDDAVRVFVSVAPRTLAEHRQQARRYAGACRMMATALRDGSGQGVWPGPRLHHAVVAPLADTGQAKAPPQRNTQRWTQPLVNDKVRDLFDKRLKRTWDDLVRKWINGDPNAIAMGNAIFGPLPLAQLVDPTAKDRRLESLRKQVDRTPVYRNYIRPPLRDQRPPVGIELPQPPADGELDAMLGKQRRQAGGEQ